MLFRSGVEVDDDEILRRNGCEEVLIISEINGDLKSEIAEPHEEILDEMGELDDQEIAEEIADELKNDLEDTVLEWQDEVEEKEVLQDILEELREDIEGEDYIPTFENEQLEFEDEEKNIGKA